MKAWRSGEAGEHWPDSPVVRRLVPRKPEALSDDGFGADDNERALRYLAKYTAEPALTHGIAGDVGTLAPGRLADIVLWKPAYGPHWGGLGSTPASLSVTFVSQAALEDNIAQKIGSKRRFVSVRGRAHSDATTSSPGLSAGRRRPSRRRR